jgi:uridine kinase
MGTGAIRNVSEKARAADAVTLARDRVVAAIRRLRETRSTPIVVALDGPSGGGKSTLAAAIADTIDAVVVPLDDFFSANVPDADWDGWTAEERAEAVFEWSRVRAEALEPLRAGEVARWHAFDFASGVREDGTYGMLAAWTIREPAPVILLDGAYSAGPQLADLVDLAVLIDAPEDVRRSRQSDREDPDFLEAWHARWDAVEDFYFGHIRPPKLYDVIVVLA